MTESKEMTVIDTNTTLAPQSAAQIFSDLGIGKEDLKIAKILLMQPTSSLVGDFNLGDLIDGSSKTKLCDKMKPLEIIPLSMYKNWKVLDMTKAESPKFVRYEAYDGAEKPWEFEEDGVKMRRDQCINVFVLLASEIANGEEAWPRMVTFSRTSYNAGKTLASHFVKLRAYRKEIFSRTVMLSTSKDKEKPHWLLNVTPNRPTTEQEKQVSQMFASMLANSNVKIDEAEEVHTEAALVKAPDVVVGKAVTDEVY